MRSDRSSWCAAAALRPPLCDRGDSWSRGRHQRLDHVEGRGAVLDNLEDIAPAHGNELWSGRAARHLSLGNSAPSAPSLRAHPTVRRHAQRRASPADVEGAVPLGTLDHGGDIGRHALCVLAVTLGPAVALTGRSGTAVVFRWERRILYAERRQLRRLRSREPASGSAAAISRYSEVHESDHFISVHSSV
jgi:hypothetical protein